MKASEAARAAAEWFTENPWTRGRSLDHETGGMCLRGALLHALTGNAYGCSTETYVTVANAVSRRVKYATVVSYNDAPGRTVDDVIHTLKLVTEDLELEGL